MVTIGRVRVDDSVFTTRFACNPDWVAGARSTCCREFEIECSRREMQAVTAVLDIAAAYVPDLRDGDDFVEVFDRDDAHTWIIERRDDGWCPFIYRDARQRPLCAIHSACLAHGLDVYAHKPTACSLWPLAVDGTGRTITRLAVQTAGSRCGCLKHCRDAEPVYRSHRAVLERLFGKRWYARLLDAARHHGD